MINSALKIMHIAISSLQSNGVEMENAQEFIHIISDVLIKLKRDTKVHQLHGGTQSRP